MIQPNQMAPQGTRTDCSRRSRLTKARLALAVTATACVLTAPLTDAAAQSVRPTSQAAAQTSKQPENAALLADRVAFQAGQLLATGNVEVHYGTTQMTATQIIYDRASGGLTITGPIRLSQDGEDFVVLASAAQLDPDLRNGILTSARLIIDQQLQLAAASMERIDGRYTALNQTVSSACRICEGSPIPLWQIRAKQVIHDNETRQLYFTNAQFRLWDIPVFFLPRLRLPDPTLKRSTGFLVPQYTSSSTVGVGVQLPYFITLGESKDLTISPYLLSKSTTLGLKYRQFYQSGKLEINGAVTSDETGNGTRGYAFATGTWDIGSDLTFGMDLRATSDISYLLDYEIYGGDRLFSRVWFDRYSQTSAFDAQILKVRTLRASEVSTADTLPFLLGDVSYEKLYSPDHLGGTAWIELSAAGSYREATTDITGMDVLRGSAQAGWKTSAILGHGLRLDAETSLTFDGYLIAQNSTYDSVVSRLTPAALLRLSYPLQRTTTSGAQQTVTPIAQLSWAKSYGSTVPNSDSNLTEFDSGNLFRTAQFAGDDRRGNGLRGTVGLKFSHIGPKANYDITIGQIIAQYGDSDYTTVSGLSTAQSDLLIELTTRLSQSVSLGTRAQLDNDMSLNKFETRLDVARDQYSLGLVHSYILASTEENRTDDLSELTLDTSFKLASNWTAFADYRYDFEQSKAATAGLGIEYANECTRVKLGVARRYTDSTAVDPTTNFTLSVSFGAYGNTAQAAQSTCGF